MKFKLLWSKNLHQKVNPGSLLIDDAFIYLAERERYITKINLTSGKTVWSSKVPDTWGWLGIFNSNLYYLGQSGYLLVINQENGEMIKSACLNTSHLRYIIFSDNVLITGGWWGYSNLTGYDVNTLDKLWSKKTTSEKLLDFSVPARLQDNLLCTVNHTTQVIEIIETISGKVKSSLSLPKELKCPDLDRSFQIVDGQVTFTSTQGKLYILSDDYLSLYTEELNIEKILTILPFFIDNKMIYEDANGNFCLYDRKIKKIVWKIRV